MTSATRLCVLLALAAATPAPASAKALPFVTARALHAWCDAADPEARQLCRGYVAGVADVVGADQAVAGMRVCFPVGIAAEAAVEAFFGFMQARPQRGFDRAADVVAEALSEAWPCR